MTKSLLQKLCCPVDKHELEVTIITETEDDEVLEALMTCPACERYFPVIYGIPVMIPDEYRDESLEAPELKKWGYKLQEGSVKPMLLDK
jgi:uncharacterized protein YbaR (Trm112 family)